MHSAPIEPDYDGEMTIRIMRRSLCVESHFQLLLWLQGELQEAIRHDVLICFSETENAGICHYDVCSPVPGIRTSLIPLEHLHDALMGVYRRWMQHGRQVRSESHPIEATAIHDSPSISETLPGMDHLMVHAIPDTRFNANHVYVLLRSAESFTNREMRAFEVLLPHIDAAVSKIDGLPLKKTDEAAPQALLDILLKAGMTTREMEILEWVRSGKTNIEIGIILDISAFTVKNHLQRIYRKLNVSNRAQAVGKFEEITSGRLAEIG